MIIIVISYYIISYYIRLDYASADLAMVLRFWASAGFSDSSPFRARVAVKTFVDEEKATISFWLASPRPSARRVPSAQPMYRFG